MTDPIQDIARQLGITTFGDGLLTKIMETIDLLQSDANNLMQYKEVAAELEAELAALKADNQNNGEMLRDMQRIFGGSMGNRRALLALLRRMGRYDAPATDAELEQLLAAGIAADKERIKALKGKLDGARQQLSDAAVDVERYKKLHSWMKEERGQLEARNAELERKYGELLLCVATKHPDETRHETAKRYLMQSESRTDSCCAAQSNQEQSA